jgi:predicted GNAT family acetyltransferase
MGPFRAVVTRDDDGHASGWVTLVDGDAGEAEAIKSLAKLHGAFAKQDIAIEVEYDSQAFPQARKWLQAAGLTLAEENPLMACRPESFVPFTTPDIAITRLTHHGKPAELEAFQRIRWTDGGDLDRHGPPVGTLRRDLKTTSSVYLLAWLDWEAAGTGVSHVTRSTAEIVGVVTQKDKRRRGVAAMVTSELVRRHFEDGGDFVFLDAANEAAARVYERLGFKRFGSMAVYK